jgi:prepilin-type N-terminal cleavage/methylation domain-containing protein
MQPSRANGGARLERQGMTLLELLLTMALMGLLLGAGMGVFATLDFGRRAALGLAQNVIRSARNSAVARGAPSRVRFDLVQGELSAEAMEVIGTWHFEDERLAGAFELDGRLGGAVIIDDGYIGRALSLALSRASYAEFDVERESSYDLAQGFAIDCALRLETAISGRVLSVGGAAGLSIEGQNTLRAWFVPEVVSTGGETRSGGRIFVESTPGALPVGVWCRVRFEYDRRVAKLFVDGVEVGRTEENEPVWRLQGPLLVGDLQGSFSGALDALVISAVAASERATLPKGVRFAPNTPLEIRFDGRGHLDREVHARPIVFDLSFDDGTAAPVGVGMYGTVN